MLFTDIDGTLLNNQGEISEANKRAAREAIDAGKHIVLCSGRSWRSIAYYEKQLGLTETGQYGVAFNGGVVYAHIAPESDERKILSETLLPKALGLRVIERLKERDAEILIYTEDECFAEDKGTPENNLQFNYRVASKLPIQFVPSFADINTDFIKILALGELPGLQQLYKVMKPEFSSEVYMIFSCPSLLEFGPPDAHKGNGMKLLADHLHIPLSEVIAMGDEGNDLTMLQMAGLGVAVANAVPEVKKAAKLVSKHTNHEDAFAQVVKEYLL
jgi:Cof subfamily protein (haloacid dehalogenase superfamily)